jgi:hypothetical protein
MNGRGAHNGPKSVRRNVGRNAETDKLRCSFLLAEGAETAWWQTAPCAGAVMLPGKQFARAL